MSIQERTSLLGLKGFIANDLLGDNTVSIIEGTSMIDSHRISRRILKGLVFICSAAAKVPYYNAALKLGSAIGPVCGVCNSIGFFVLEVWAANQVLDSLLGPRTHEEKAMYSFKDNRCKRYTLTTCFISIGFLFAAASQLPTGLAAMKYNPSWKEIACGVTIAAGSLLPLRSLQLSLEATRNRFRTSVEKNLLLFKSKMLSQLRRNIFVPFEDFKIFVDAMSNVQKENNIGKEKEKYTLLLFSNNENTQKVSCQGSRKFGECVGFLLNIGFQISLGFYTYKETKEFLYDNDAFAGILAGIAVSSNVYLMGTAIQKTTGRIFQLVQDIFTCQYQPTIIQTMRPGLTTTLQLIGLVIDGFAIGPSIVIWGDFYSEYGKTAQITATAIVCGAVFFLIFTAMIDTMEDITTTLLLRRGSEEEKKVLRLQEKAKRVIAAIEDAPFVDFAKSITHLPEALKNDYLAKVKISSLEINKYIENRLPKSVEEENDGEDA